MAMFGQGLKPTVAFINQAKTPLGVDLPKLVAASQKFLDTYFEPVWGVGAECVLVQASEQANLKPGYWGMVFLDSLKQANALGYHEVTKDGYPISKVFVQDTLRTHQKVSAVVCHELCEMLIDPGIQMWAMDNNSGICYAYEMCDAVEDFGFDVDSITMSDFVYPSFFESWRMNTTMLPGMKFSHLGNAKHPFHTTKGGYQITLNRGKIAQVYGSLEKANAFALEDRRGHRSEYRVPLAAEEFAPEDLAAG